MIEIRSNFTDWHEVPERQAMLYTDPSKEVYIGEDRQIHYAREIYNYRFYPMCPKEAPKMESPEYGEQMSLEDFMKE